MENPIDKKVYRVVNGIMAKKNALYHYQGH